MKVLPAVREAAAPALPDAWPAVPDLPDDDIYPTSTPTMPELAPHSDNGDLIRHAIKCRFEDLGRSCRCLGNVHLFYREGAPDYVAPDVMVFPDLPGDYPAPHYKIWEDGAPALVVEVLSKRTWKDDAGLKKDVYRAMGVREYWIFNPIRSVASTQPALQGYYWRPDGYAAVRPTRDWVAGVPTELFPSDVLDTVWGVEDNLLRLFNPREKAWYASSEESHAQKKDAERRAATAERHATETQRRAATAERHATEAQRRAATAERHATEAQRRAATAERHATEAQRRAATAERHATEVEAEVERLRHLLHAHGLASNGRSSSDDAREAGAACP